MKKTIILLVASITSAMSASAQNWVDDLDFNEFDRPKTACYINDTFVKNFVGFDLGENSGVTHVSKQTPEKPIIINGVEYPGKIVLTCERNIKFTTLKEIKKKNYPDVTGPVMFMIDHYFVMTDADLYKLDEDYISKCELLSSKSFDVFKDQPDFSIIRVFTKRDRIFSGQDRSLRLR